MSKALVRSSQITILRGYQQIAVAQSAITHLLLLVTGQHRNAVNNGVNNQQKNI